MPIYEFICQNCNYEFEKIQSFSDTTVPQCANCGSDQVSRRLSPPAIHFKGSGWYINDSKKASKDSASRNGNGSQSEGSSVSESGESKSASSASGESTGGAKAETSGATSSGKSDG